MLITNLRKNLICITVDIALTKPFVIKSCLMCLTMSNCAAFCFGIVLSAII